MAVLIGFSTLFFVAYTDLSGREKEYLTQLSSDRSEMTNFYQTTLLFFWSSFEDNYPLLPSTV